MAFHQAMDFHEGEERMHRAMQVPPHDNPTFTALSPQLANHLQVAPLIALGLVDQEGRPWTTLWGGEPGFAQSLGGGIAGIRTAVTGKYDPVVEELTGKDSTGQVIREGSKGRMLAGLTIDLETRKRVKMAGRMLACAVSMREDEVTGHDENVAELQLVLKVEQSMGNCPKYLNSKHIVPAFARPQLVDDSPYLSQRALDLLARADMFFISTYQHDEDMDCNHRGGPPGFVRVVSNEKTGAVLCYPEYSGNRLYQSLGNLMVNAQAGICVPDFSTGDMLYATGTTEILVGDKANSVLPRSNLAVKITVTSARFVAEALPFRGIEGKRSPYNPVVRYLASETKLAVHGEELQQATLLSQTKLTPDISRFKFGLENPASYRPGQYVTLDLSSHLDMGYSHMRNEDPRSINDDFVRTFTVSSAAGEHLKENEFETTLRKVGPVTAFLFHQQDTEKGGRRRVGIDVGIKGFGGDFEVKQSDDETICFIAAGVGITPILSSLSKLEHSRLRLLWTIRLKDTPLVQDILKQRPSLGQSLTVHITDAKEQTAEIRTLEQSCASVHRRRMMKDDVGFDEVQKYYLCTPMPLRKELMKWLEGKDVIFEDFNF